MAGAASRIHHAVVRRVDEADELRALAVQKRIGARRIGARGIAPRLGKARQHVGRVHDFRILRNAARDALTQGDARIAAVAIGAAQVHRIARMHRRPVACRMAGETAAAFACDLLIGLVRGRGRCCAVVARDGMFLLDPRAHRAERRRDASAREQHERRRMRERRCGSLELIAIHGSLPFALVSEQDVEEQVARIAARVECAESAARDELGV